MKPTSLNYGWGSLWRAHLALPSELASTNGTVFIREIRRDDAHAAMRRAIQVLYPRCAIEDLDDSYYNLTSAPDLILQGVSLCLNDRLFETGWQGEEVCAWVEHPVFLVPDAAELFQAWRSAVEA